MDNFDADANSIRSLNRSFCESDSGFKADKLVPWHNNHVAIHESHWDSLDILSKCVYRDSADIANNSIERMTSL